MYNCSSVATKYEQYIETSKGSFVSRFLKSLNQIQAHSKFIRQKTEKDY